MHFVLFFIFEKKKTNSKPGAFWDNQYHERSIGFICRNMKNMDFILLQKFEDDFLVLSVFGTVCSSVCFLPVVACLVHPCCRKWCYCAVSPPGLAISSSTLPPLYSDVKIYICNGTVCVFTFLIFFFFSFSSVLVCFCRSVASGCSYIFFFICHFS